jgi:Uma2 family endonuclease
MNLVADKPTKPRVKRWTKREYNDLVEKGAFQGQRVYLFRGEFIEMPPMGGPHAKCVMKVANWLYPNFRPQHDIRIQMPFEAPGESMPEPDAAVVTIDALQRSPHPNAALLIIEVSDSSIYLDHDKAFEYAAAGVPDYWIIDLNGRQIEVYRQPVKDDAAPLGFRYASHHVVAIGESLSPVAQPAAKILVSELLP